MDTIPTKTITEKAVSYDKALYEQYVYSYDSEGRLKTVTHTNAQGTDVTSVEYTSNKGEDTVSYSTNGDLVKTIRTATLKKKDGNEQNVVLTKLYLEGVGHTAKEVIFDDKGKPTAQQDFEYNQLKNQFVPTNAAYLSIMNTGIWSLNVSQVVNKRNPKPISTNMTA